MVWGSSTTSPFTLTTLLRMTSSALRRDATPAEDSATLSRIVPVRGPCWGGAGFGPRFPPGLLPFDGWGMAGACTHRRDTKHARAPLVSGRGVRGTRRTADEVAICEHLRLVT
eukprot:7780341-Pyramimonas_sp.AAC.4